MIVKWLHKVLGLAKLEAEIARLKREQNNLRGALRRLDKWTEDAVDIGVDIHHKTPHRIWIVTSLGGGQIREIEVNFQSITQVRELVKELEHRYRARVHYDIPPGELQRMML